MSIGNFDGVHRGHARIVETLNSRAADAKSESVIFTFDPHPVRLLRPEQCPPPLTWTERKADLLGKLAVDWIIAYPTDEALLRLSARQFFEQIVVEALGAVAIVEGPNFFFGHEREGTIDTLTQFARDARIGLEVVQPVLQGDGFVSSSRIRLAIAAGDVGAARSMLTEPYRIRGMVTHGAGRGSRIGFPTANLDGIDTLLPGEGVYAGRAWIGGTAWPAAINIGPNPTFAEKRHKVEAHVIDYEGSLYGQALEVDFLERLREIRPFDSPAALIAQLRLDVERIRSQVR